MRPAQGGRRPWSGLDPSGALSLRMLAAGILLLFGIALVLSCVESYVLHHRAGAWVEVPATIHYADVYYQSPSATAFLARHWIASAYTYTRGGRSYRRHRFGFDVETAADPEPLRHRIRKVLAAKPTVAFVDPDDPGRAVLDRSFPALVTGWLGLGMLGASLGLALAMHARAARGRARVFSIGRWAAVATALLALAARPFLLRSFSAEAVFAILVAAWVLVPAAATAGAWKLGTWVVGE